MATIISHYIVSFDEIQYFYAPYYMFYTIHVEHYVISAFLAIFLNR